MAKGYWIVQSDINDMEQHQEYVRANRAVLGRYGARFLVRWGTQSIEEGTARARQVVIEFPDFAAATSCYRDPEYAAAHALRIGAAEGDVVIVEGYDGPQPVLLAEPGPGAGL
ncbi:MAG: DUF1330 domain-containing protein [Cytophagaceae bacterium]|nr:DUF1330 domain-containing protein [Gemmatimonadaceae bacterium]